MTVPVRFYFDVCLGANRVRDDTGYIFPDISAAITAALFDGDRILERLGCRGQPLCEKIFEIRDGSGKVVAQVPIDI